MGDNQISGRVRECGANGRALAEIFFMAEPDPAKFLEVVRDFKETLETFDCLWRTVLRAIVDDDDLDMFEPRGLIQDRQPPEAGFDQILLVVRRTSTDRLVELRFLSLSRPVHSTGRLTAAVFASEAAGFSADEVTVVCAAPQSAVELAAMRP